MLKIVTICVALTCCPGACPEKLLEREQLPLSQNVLKTFPKLKTKYLIIAVPKLRIVLHELNSNQSIRSGNFSELLSGMASLAQSTTTPNIDQFLKQYGRKIPKYTDIAHRKFGILISLYELCNIFEQEYLYILRNHNSKRIARRIKLFMFYAGKNIGCMCRYINVNNVAFDIIVYHEYNENTFLHDIEKIIQWLDRFIIKELNIPTKPINISVFYGKQSSMYFTLPNGHRLLIEKNVQEKIVRTVRYYMRLSAPVTTSDKIGYVFYKYSLFGNPIRFDIFSNISISKSNMFKNLVDSIYYIIYNKPRA